MQSTQVITHSRKPIALFSGEPFSSLGQEKLSTVLRETKRVPPRELRDRPETYVHFLIRTYSLRVATVKVQDAQTHIHPGQTGAGGSTNPTDGTVTVRVYLPFDGDPMWFTLAPSYVQGEPIMAEVKSQSLILTFEGADIVSCLAQLEYSLDSLNANLEALCGEVEMYQHQLQDLVWSKLAERRIRLKPGEPRLRRYGDREQNHPEHPVPAEAM